MLFGEGSGGVASGWDVSSVLDCLFFSSGSAMSSSDIPEFNLCSP